MSSVGAAGGRRLKIGLSLGLLLLTVLVGAVGMGLFSQGSRPPSGALPEPFPTSVTPSRDVGSAFPEGLDSTDALVGHWIAESGEELTFAESGTFEVHDPSRADVSGTYAVDGRTVTLFVPGSGRTTYRWTVKGSTLNLVAPDGTVREYERAR